MTLTKYLADEELEKYAARYPELTIKMIARIRKGEPVSLDMESYAKESFPGPYQAAVDVCRNMEKRLGITVASQEAAFLAIHIQRVREEGRGLAGEPRP